jgi:hypothetical protein
VVGPPSGATVPSTGGAPSIGTAASPGLPPSEGVPESLEVHELERCSHAVSHPVTLIPPPSVQAIFGEAPAHVVQVVNFAHIKMGANMAVHWS